MAREMTVECEVCQRLMEVEGSDKNLPLHSDAVGGICGASGAKIHSAHLAGEAA